jgi:hypothetical protein
VSLQTNETGDSEFISGLEMLDKLVWLDFALTVKKNRTIK